jgi:hypothetical protein
MKDTTNEYERGFTDGGRYVLSFLVNEHNYEIPSHIEIWEDFYEIKEARVPLSLVIEKERLRILKNLDMIEQQSNATRTPLYQETLISLIRDRINNG